MKFIKRLLVVGVLLSAILLVAGYFLLAASLPVLEGEWPAAAISQPVTIQRDEQGIPTITARSDPDTAYALGFVHGQDRYFQMDLLRRNAAGELSELFGSVALDWDRQMRVHRFRHRAEQIVAALPDDQRAVLVSYTAGVNAGRLSLGVRPFEYIILMQAVRPWEAADSLLCVYAMYTDLQHADASYERSLDFMQSVLPQQWFEFLRPRPAALADQPILQWEAPLAGEVKENLSLPDMPLAELLALLSPGQALADYRWQDEGVPGSNNWGVAGSLTAHGAAMVANDMHLRLRVPNTWYRASWYLSDGRRVTGVTLPGTPAMVVGSNEAIAWGFTNSYGDWGEVIRLVTDELRSQYLTPEGWVDFTYHEESIMVNNFANPFTVRETQWGPVIGEDQQGYLLAYRWVAHDPQGANFNLLKMAAAESSEQALAIAASSGMPAQNLMLADRNGQLNWSIMGPIPNRQWRDYQWVQDWSQVDGNWSGYLAAEAYPRISSSAHQDRLWTANARVVMDQRFALIGDGGYDIGIRAGSIAQRLAALPSADAASMLSIQLDTHNRMLDGWANHLKAVVDIEPEPVFAAQVIAILKEWDGKADVDSVSYRLVKSYRQAVLENTLGPVYMALEQQDYAGFRVKDIDNYIDNALWLLVNEQPEHLLNPAYSSWEALLLTAARTAISKLKQDGLPLEEATWGRVNRLNIQHPLSRAVPVLAGLLDMPRQMMPGDGKNVVRIQGQSFGASERMVVAPGQEAQGILAMPTGQSGHPLSPFYRAGHQDWVSGKPSAFLPQTAIYTLKLLPVAHN